MKTRITIRGRQYTVRGDDPSEDIQSVAEELERRIEEVAGRTTSFDEYTVVLLTALNLASDLRRARERARERLAEVDRELAAIGAMLEAALPAREGGS